MRTKREIEAEIRQLRKEMRAKGIRRLSFMNGGHSPESYRYNARIFQLETEKGGAK